MTTITYIEANGQTLSVDVADGWTVMQGAVANGIEGIIGECGGSCACATCHCYVEETRLDELAPPSASELDLLEAVAADRRSNSRLACQIQVRADLDGLRVQLPDCQL